MKEKQTQNVSPKVSVIFPIYNNEKYLKKCIQSVIDQTLKDIELILIDDGSTDGASIICDNFAKEDNRVRVVHKENEGSAAGRNQGIEMATGEYIAFVESDDFVSNDMYEQLYKRALITNADIVKCGFYRHRGKEKEEDRRVYVTKEYEVFEAKKYPQIFRSHASIWAGIYRREFLESFGLRFLVTPKATYSDFSWRAMTYAYAKRMTILPRPLYHYTNDNPDSSYVFYGERYPYTVYHAKEAARILREAGIYEEVKDAFSDQAFGYCIDAAKYVASAQRRDCFEGLRDLCQEIFRTGFGYQYFNNWSKMLASYILNNEPEKFYDLLFSKWILYKPDEFQRKKVVLFGTGECGINYEYQLRKQNITIVKWIDHNPKPLLGAEPPESISDLEFDILLIAAVNETTATEIKRKLQFLGVSENKITWRMPLRLT